MYFEKSNIYRIFIKNEYASSRTPWHRQVNPVCKEHSTIFVAEREGFEPPLRLPANLISSQAHSTTLPSLPFRFFSLPLCLLEWSETKGPIDDAALILRSNLVCCDLVDPPKTHGLDDSLSSCLGISISRPLGVPPLTSHPTPTPLGSLCQPLPS